ncbi:MAG: archaeal heat shock protein Hsp20 [Candidatus Thorarchaeota archaeon]|jgi:HSP20 family protein
MSWDNDDETRRKLRRWFGDAVPEEMFQMIEELMKKMMSEMNEGSMFDSETFEEMLRNPEGTSPFVFGFSMNVGPDGKPIIQRFGNPTDEGVEHSSTLEPLVDVVEEDDEIIVVAEVPGVERDEIKVRIKGTSLTIKAENPERPYHKVIELPGKVLKEEAKSAIRNGVLEVRLKKA